MYGNREPAWTGNADVARPRKIWMRFHCGPDAALEIILEGETRMTPRMYELLRAAIELAADTVGPSEAKE